MSINHTVRFKFAALALFSFAAPACLFPAPVGTDRDAGTDAPSADGGVKCMTVDGRRFNPGDTFPAEDGCNTCSCNADGTIMCTLIGCVDGGPAPDAGPRTCTTSAQCNTGEMCIGPQGCGVPWTCQPAGPCTADFGPFCSCRGVTVFGSSSCPPEPYAHRGECAASDAGPGPGACMRTGCSGQLCADREVPSTCEFRPEYACYRSATCERQAGGACGWTPSPELDACLTSARDGGVNDGGAAPGACIRTGCSGHICADREVASTCEFRPEYACYRSATCERQADGACGWTPSPTLATCLAAARDGGM